MTFFRARLAPPDNTVRPEEASWRNNTERTHLVWADAPDMVQLRPHDIVVLALRPPEGGTLDRYSPFANVPEVPSHPNRWSLNADKLRPVENLHAPMLVRMKPGYRGAPGGLTEDERNSWYQAWPSGYSNGDAVVLFDHSYRPGRGGMTSQYYVIGAPDAIRRSNERACWNIPRDLLDIVETPHEVATVATPTPPAAVTSDGKVEGATPQFTITDDGQRTAKLVMADGTEWVRASNVAEIAMEYAKENNWCGEVRRALGAMGIDHQTEERWVVTVNLETEFELAVMAKNSEEAEEKARHLVPGRLPLTGADLDGDDSMPWDTARYDADEDDD